MGVEVHEQRDSKNGADRPADKTQASEPGPPERTSWLSQGLGGVRDGFRSLEWRQVLLFGALAGVLMPLSLSGGFGQILSFFAGIVPVGAGLLIGRRVQGNYGLHGFMTGLVASVISLAVLAFVIFYTPLGITAGGTVAPGSPTLPPASIFVQLGGFIAFSLVTFCTFGAAMAGRSQERVRSVQREVDERGGRLERPSAVRTADDIRGLSLPQFGYYVNNLFKKQGFTFKDYRFIDKDKHLDLWLEREGEPWHLRMTVSDKVGPGTIEGLYQKMKDEGCRKGVVLASTEFLPTATKAAKGRPIVLIDGPTLFEIAEG